MRKTMASMSLFGLMLGVSLAPSVLALGQTPAGREQSALHAPVKHAPVCPGPAAAGTARCHAHVVVDNVGKPLATSGPAGYRPADLRMHTMSRVPVHRAQLSPLLMPMAIRTQRATLRRIARNSDCQPVPRRMAASRR
jgi:hypothetical protein